MGATLGQNQLGATLGQNQIGISLGPNQMGVGASQVGVTLAAGQVILSAASLPAPTVVRLPAPGARLNVVPFVTRPVGLQSMQSMHITPITHMHPMSTFGGMHPLGGIHSMATLGSMQQMTTLGGIQQMNALGGMHPMSTLGGMRVLPAQPLVIGRIGSPLTGTIIETVGASGAAVPVIIPQPIIFGQRPPPTDGAPKGDARNTLPVTESSSGSRK